MHRVTYSILRRAQRQLRARFIAIFALGVPLVVLVAIACTKEILAPDSSPMPESPSQVVSDGGHGGGNPHFFFLPPLVAQPTVSGTSDGNASPTVLVCEWNSALGPSGQCVSVIAQFSRVTGTGSEVVSYDAAAQQYKVNWQTNQCSDGPCALDSRKSYRLRVLIAATELGYADIQVAANGSQLKNVSTNDYIAFVDGRTLPVKFRIEQGAVSLVAPGGVASVGSAGGKIATDDGTVALSIPAGALATSADITVEASTVQLPGTGAWATPVILGPDGTTFAQPVRLTLSYDASKLPEGVTPDALKLSTWVDDHWEVVPGSTLNIADATVSADIAHFSYYGIAIWPNASYNNATQQVELTKGQRTTLNGYTYYVYTYPQTQCWQVRRWVRYWGGGYWTYYQQCTTYTQAYSYPTQGVRVSWLSSAPSVASLGSPAYSVTDAGGRTQSPPITALTAGSTDVTGSASGVTSSSTRVTVLPSLLFSVFGTGTNPFRKFGFRQGTGLVSIIPAPLAAPLTVTLTHTNSSVASSNPTAIIGAGRTSEGVTLIAGEVAGRDTIIGTAPGYTPDTLVVETALGRISVDGWPSSLAYGDSAAIRIHPTNEDGFIDNAWLTSFALGSNGKLSFSRNSVAITSITVPDGSSSTPVFYVKAVGAGSGIMSVANNWYITSPYEVPIVGGFVSIQVAPDPAGVIPGGTVQLTGTARNAAGDPVSGVDLSWSSANTALATVDANGLVTGVANGTVIVTASSGGISGSATVRVGTPSISASPGSLTLPVKQGQSAQAQITITNGGGGVLSGLQAGSFSNYFNGSPAPWVTASWNTTTAPATLTITAAPGLGIPTGVHQLRFDVSAPGASNSPYTFYSINITVIAAGVTPVNATISPTPGSVSFNVALGQSAQAQIAINNSGTDPLTNLTAGPFSNYFNGSPAPWVTASFNTTTAPATLTITAAPDASVALGTHQLRFEVSSPGATNSPYTFYSINVTVTEPPFRLGSIDAAGGFTCATTLRNAAYCWGSNGGVGTLGIGITNNNNYPTPIAVAGGLSFASVSTDASHTCALTPEGAAYCWGYGSDTRLGTGIDQGSNVPVAVAGGHTFVQIDVGDNHACAVDNLQRAYCWGYGMLGNLANTASASSRGNSSVPTLVLGGVQFLRVVAGGNFSCGVATDQTAYCWGLNSVGQLGAPSPTTYNCDPYTCSLLPTAVSGGLQFQSITAGSQHACGVTTGGEVYCWGGNGSGQLGDGSTINSLVPVRVSSVNGATQVDAGNAHSCARTGFGQLYCWGANASGQLGRGNQISSPSAGLVSGNGMSFSRVTAGGAHSCAITSVGSAYCWGGNGNGQLGIGSVTAPQTVPTLVAVP